MQVTLVQLAATLDSAANRAQVEARLSDLDGPGLVVLPEATMHDFGPADHDLAAVAEPLDGPFVDLIAREAKRLGSTIVAGMFERTDDLPYNTLVVVAPDGDLAATYRKIHLYDSFGYRESERLRAGEIEPVVVPVEDLTIGLMTCYDLRFPELARALVDRGADAFVVPAAWVAGEHKAEHWRTLLRARAIENTVWVAAAAQGGSRYTGRSLVADPWGTIVEEAAGGDELVTAQVAVDAVRASRDVNPSLANRRISTP
ncbi:carbon-nitrogen hydrolase family protein [Aeromicrobium sp. Marseille-Q0843]|uniref:Carbon-nitrogen hydrolase family protein n=1 Tax=Aeromicrobium phoceense TaxID=2754045 RepID=A0A838X9S1_9ACTN|nr:carbon-nitrogen hydrolase family protein [Aeromicrobium phoceense]MBA4607315.1 carbon-nitrogen hydrolase family protein [Aeromicrobium phoceense]